MCALDCKWCGSTHTGPPERREQMYWWCPQTLCEMEFSQEDLCYMGTLSKILVFFQNFGKKCKGEAFLNFRIQEEEEQEELVWFANELLCSSCRGRELFFCVRMGRFSNLGWEASLLYMCTWPVSDFWEKTEEFRPFIFRLLLPPMSLLMKVVVVLWLGSQQKSTKSKSTSCFCRGC